MVNVAFECPPMLNLIPYFPNSLEINGHKQGPNSGYKPGSVALYHCHEGFVLLPFSAGKRVCRKGKWEGTIPACGRSDSSFCTSIRVVASGWVRWAMAHPVFRGLKVGLVKLFI